MGSRRNTARLRLLGLALIALLTAGFDDQPENALGPCIRAPGGCLVCEANGGACTVEFCDGGVDHDCF